MTNQNIPKTPVQQSKQSFKRIILNHIAETDKLVLSIKREMHDEIEKKVMEKYGQNINTLEVCRDFAVIVFSVLKQKGVLTREEIDDIIEKLKKQNKDVEQILRRD
jgi:hypothetical protein